MTKASSNKTLHTTINTANCIVCKATVDIDSALEKICSKCFNDVFGNDTSINSHEYEPADQL